MKVSENHVSLPLSLIYPRRLSSNNFTLIIQGKRDVSKSDVQDDKSKDKVSESKVKETTTTTRDTPPCKYKISLYLYCELNIYSFIFLAKLALIKAILLLIVFITVISVVVNQSLLYRVTTQDMRGVLVNTLGTSDDTFDYHLHCSGHGSPLVQIKSNKK